MSSDIVKALNILCEEKGLEYEVVMEALESALAAAYRKDFGNRQGNYKVQFDPETGDMKVWDVKEVVADIDAEVLEKAQEALAALRDKVKEDGKKLTSPCPAILDEWPRRPPNRSLSKNFAKRNATAYLMILRRRKAKLSRE